MIGKDCFLGICLASSKHFLSQKKKNLKADDLKSVILFSSKVSFSTSSWFMHGNWTTFLLWCVNHGVWCLVIFCDWWNLGGLWYYVDRISNSYLYPFFLYCIDFDSFCLYVHIRLGIRNFDWMDMNFSGGLSFSGILFFLFLFLTYFFFSHLSFYISN